jgi:N-acetylmuramoyl-L-alanine amidase
MKICVDPGHGMSNRQMGVYDPGATHVESGFRFEEATLTLRYGLALKDVLRARQIACFMTRDDDQDHAPVGKRAGMAKAAECDILVSLHVNDFDDDSANGLEVLYGDAQFAPFAVAAQEALIAVTGMRDRDVSQRKDLAVLKFQGPAILVELGFIANDADRNKILGADMRDAICRTIADVLEEQFGEA